MKLKNIGEFALINKISAKMKTDESVIKAVGDDAAVIRWVRDTHLLFASDMMVEGVHFNLSRCRPFDIGWKALGINISDIAAMGGVPRYATVSLGLPKKADLKFADGVSSGLRSMAGKFDVNIVGGDTSSSKKVVIDVAIIGEVKRNQLVLRSGAKAGDFIAVTGRLGGSLRGRHLKFTPRVKEAQFLVKNFKISSMIDISDGLSSDLMHICKQSRVGAKIYESLIPMSKDAGSIKNALNDGEDFELLFTISRDSYRGLMKKFRKTFKTSIFVVGEITDRRMGIGIVNQYGRISPLKICTFKHF